MAFYDYGDRLANIIETSRPVPDCTSRDHTNIKVLVEDGAVCLACGDKLVKSVHAPHPWITAAEQKPAW